MMCVFCPFTVTRMLKTVDLCNYYALLDRTAFELRYRSLYPFKVPLTPAGSCFVGRQSAFAILGVLLCLQPQ